MNIDIKNILKTLYFFGIAGLLIAMPFSNFFMSFFQFFILGAWLLDFNFKHKFKTFVNNKYALIVTSLFLLHIIGLAWTNDYAYALKDLRIKLPLLMMPIVLSTGHKINKKYFENLLLLFTASVIIASFFCTKKYLLNDYTSIRDISIFISHIRFALFICFSIFVLLFFLLKKNRFTKFQKTIFLLSLLWLLLFLNILNSLTGAIIFILTAIAVLFFLLSKKKNKKYKLVMLISSLSIILIITVYIIIVLKDYNIKKTINFKQLDTHTASGNLYLHDTLSAQCENGNLIYIYINYDELEAAWNKRSTIKFDSINNKASHIKDILIRYLSSKGLRKDKEGVEALEDNEIAAIEKGLTNYLLLSELPFERRIYQILWEYQYYCNTGNPSGLSVMQRIEYLKVAFNIIKQNFIFGVGTGDVKQAFDNHYEQNNSQLDKEWRLRAHNQYVTMFVAFGLIGLIWFLLVLFYPPIKMKLFKDYYFFVFFIIIVLSMLNEDTLETQAGVTFFAFYFSFLLFARENEDYL